MPEDDEYKNSSESNENRSEELQSDLNNKGFEQYVNKNENEEAINEDGNTDAIIDKDYFQDNKGISQENSSVIKRNYDKNSNQQDNDVNYNENVEKQVDSTDNYYHYESTSGSNKNVSESKQDYSSNQESSLQASSQTPSNYSVSNSQNVSQQSSAQNSNKLPINEQGTSTSVLNSTEQESANFGTLRSEGANSGSIKSESANSTPINTESESSSTVLKNQGTSSRVLRRSTSTGDLQRSKSSILQNKDKNRDKDKNNSKDKNRSKDSSKKSSAAKILNVASSAANMLKVNDEQSSAENILNNLEKEAIQAVKSAMKKLGKRATLGAIERIEKLAIEKLTKKLIKKGISKKVAKRMAEKAVKKVSRKVIIKVLNSTKVGAVISVPGQAVNTVKNISSGNVADTIKYATISALSGNFVPVIIIVGILIIVILFGISLMGDSLSKESQQGNSYNKNDYNYVKVGKNSEGEKSDDEKGNSFTATSMINFNKTFNNLNDYFYKYPDNDKNMISNSLSKANQSIDLMKKLAKKIVQTKQLKYDIFDDYFIKYFFDDVTSNQLKNKIKTDIKNNGMIFTETYIGKEIEANKLYNSFKKDLDSYKEKINQIKTNTEKTEEEDENTFRTRIINEFKTQNPNANFIYLTCFKPLSNSNNLQVTKNIDMNLENRWENTRELTGLLYFIKNINDIDENRNLNIEANDLENILKSLEDELLDLNISIIGKNSSGEDLDFNYIYGSKRKKTSLYLEKEFLNTCDIKYQEIIDGIGKKEDIAEVNLSDYKNIMDNVEDWTLIRNLQIFENLVSNYGDIPNNFLLGNNQNDEDEESEEETYDFNNCIYKIYSTIQEKIVENFGTSDYKGSEPYERKNNNIFYKIPEIDVTAIDKTFYFPTQNTQTDPLIIVKKDEIIQRVEDLTPLLIHYQNKIKDIQIENKNEISDVEKKISNENPDSFIIKGDKDSKYIYEDSNIDDLFVFNDLSTIEVDNENYYVLDDVAELSEIKLNLTSKDFLTWFKDEEDDTSFYNNYIPEAFFLTDDDDLDDMTDLENFAEILKNADESLKPEIFEDANQQYEKLLSSPGYDLSEEYIAFKYLLFGGMQNFEPVLNQIWEENLVDMFGNYVEETNSTTNDIPFSKFYNDYISLNIATGKDIYAVCSGKVVDKTNNSIVIRCSNHEFGTGTEGAKKLFDENNYVFYVEYKNLSPNVNVGDEVFRYPVPTEYYIEEDEEGNIKDSTVIGKAKAEDLQIKCYIYELKENFDSVNDSYFDKFVYTFGEDSVFKQKLLINPRLIIQDDDGLPIEPYVIPPSPTPRLYPSPSYKMLSLPPKVETPMVTAHLEPPDPLHRNLLFVFGTITYYVGLLYAIWAIIKFALGLHDYESANYQAIWQFIAASVLIFGALILKHLSGL